MIVSSRIVVPPAVSEKTARRLARARRDDGAEPFVELGEVELPGVVGAVEPFLHLAALDVGDAYVFWSDTF